MSKANPSLLAALLLSACAVESASDVPPEAEIEPVAAPVLLADVDLGDDHHVQFVETFPGAVTIAETGPGSFVPQLMQRGLGRLVDFYASLGVEQDPTVIERLAQAQERVDALNAQAALIAEAGGPEPIAPNDETEEAGDELVDKYTSSIDTISPGTVLSHDAFEAMFCNAGESGLGGEYCRIVQTSTNTGWQAATSWIRSAVINAWPGTVQHRIHHYVCLQSFPIIGCVDQDWRHDYTQTLTWPTGAEQMLGMYVDTYPYTKFDASGGWHNMAVVWP